MLMMASLMRLKSWIYVCMYVFILAKWNDNWMKISIIPFLAGTIWHTGLDLSLERRPGWQGCLIIIFGAVVIIFGDSVMIFDESVIIFVDIVTIFSRSMMLFGSVTTFGKLVIIFSESVFK